MSAGAAEDRLSVDEIHLRTAAAILQNQSEGRIFSKKNFYRMTDNKHVEKSVEERDPAYFGYYSQLVHQVLII